MSFVLEAEQLCVDIDDHEIFSNLSFRVSGGQCAHITGPNGSGKSTLLMLLCGLFADYRGQYRWRCEDETLQPALLCERLIFMSTKSGIHEALSPEENLAWYAALMGVRLTAKQRREALARVGLQTGFSRPVATLSSGQRQRVKLARLGIAWRPFWLLDEPFTALDHAAVADLETRLIDHAKAGGLVLFTSHHRLAHIRPNVKIQLAVGGILSSENMDVGVQG
ncbi:MAG: heme ABC exporter ATP-binding protein CcmA [Gammaproteobacteria bacterium]